MRRRALGAGVVTLALLVAVGGAGGVAARQPRVRVVSVNCAANPGVLITKPGRYLIERSVENCNADPIVQISSSRVDLDLGGRLLAGDGGCQRVIAVDAGKKRVVIRNGVVRGCADGIFSSGRGVTISRVIASDQIANGLDTPDAVIRHSTALGTSGTGIRVGKGQASGNIAVGTQSAGIDAKDGSSVTRNIVAATGPLADGFFAAGRASRNISIGNGGGGMASGNGSILTRNLVRGNVGIGIALDEDSTAKRNRVLGNGGDGISMDLTGNTASRNVVDGNAGSGLTAPNQAQNSLVGNVARGNLLDGIYTATAGDVIKKNTVRGNVDNGIEAALPNSSQENLALDNTSPCVGVVCGVAKAEKGTPILLTCPAGVTISAPGLYRLVRSVSNCNAGNAITIASSDVTLDLMGRRVDGDGLGLDAGISMTSGLTNVHVQNGTVSDWFFGVSVQGNDTSVSRVVATGNGVAVGAGTGSTVAGNTLARNATGIVASDGVSIIGNMVVANTGVGISAMTQNNMTITRNLIAGNGSHGIEGNNGNRIEGNRIVGNGGTGIRLEDNSIIDRNVVIGNGQSGIFTDSQSVVTRNVSLANNSNGITASHSGGIESVVASNVANGNGASGIFHDGSDGTIRSNIVRGNLGDGIVSGPAVISNNIAEGNVDEGIDAPTSSGSGNRARFNGTVPECDPATLC
jgi:parallel beta-helix repeat protein